MKKHRREFDEVVIDAFKVGKYPQGEFTQKELAEIAESYNPKVYEAPITIGHVSDYKGQTTIPAFGWIDKIKVVGDHLKLIASQFSEELKGWYKDGKYKKVSAAFYQPSDPSNPTPGKWHLHHLAFLGGQPPQVKGLEGIAFGEFAAAVEFAEEDAQVSGVDLDPVEKAGTQDTYENIQESFASCLAKIQDALASDAEYSVKQQRMNLALSDCYSEISNEIGEHFSFIKKIEDMEEKGEYSEIKGRLVELAQKIFRTKERKEQDAMDAQKQKEYEDKIAALDAQVKEFSAAKEKFDKEKADAEARAADEKLKGDIKEFCDKNNLNTKKAEDAKVQDVLYGAAKVSAEFFESTKSAILAFAKADAVTPGVSPEFAKEQPKPDGRPEVFKNAEKYVADHPKEFAELKSAQEKINRAVSLRAQGKIRF